MANLFVDNETGGSESQQNFSTEGKYEIILYNYQGKQFTIDASSMVNFNIYETLFDDNVIKGDITILDSRGFEEVVPIIGQEEIYFKFNNTKLPDTFYEKTFVVYKMSNRLFKDRKQIYQLHFVSREFILNLKYRISKSYKSKIASEIVYDIWENYIQKNVDLDQRKPLLFERVGNADATFFKRDFIFPYIRPFQAINMVANKSVSSSFSENGGNSNRPNPNYGSFVFFENKTGFFFKSINDLLDPQITSEPADYNMNMGEATSELGVDVRQLNPSERESSTAISVSTPAQVISSTVPSVSYIIRPQNVEGYTLSSNDTTIMNYKFKSTFDIISNLVGGLYGSQLLTYDPITQMIGEDHYSGNNRVYATDGDQENSFFKKGTQRINLYENHYLTEIQNFRHIREHMRNNFNNEYGPLVGEYHIGLGSSQAFYKYKSTNHLHDLKIHVSLLDRIMTAGKKTQFAADNQIERYLLQRYAQKMSLNNIVLDITIAGDHNRRVGEIVEIKLPSYRYDNEEHSYYKGNYLLSKIRHTMNTEGIYMTEMELIKDVLFEPLQEWEPEVIRDGSGGGVILEGEDTGTPLNVPGAGNSETHPNTYPKKPGDTNNQLIY